MTGYDVADEVLVPTVFAAADPLVRAAREVYGPLPRLRSSAFPAAPIEVQQAVLVIGGTAWVLGDPVRVLLREVARDVRGTGTEPWRGLARRAGPT
jgi:hypothetical protein